MSKTLVTIIILIIIVGIGYLIFRSPEPKDEVLSLLNELKQETGIAFSEVSSTEIEWNVKKYDEIDMALVQTQTYNVKGIFSSDYAKVETFFQDNGFKEDVYNIAESMVGYRKGDMVCTILTSNWLDEEDLPLETGEIDIEVNCGKPDVSVEHLFSKEEMIKKLFAAKYNKKMAEITLDITHETDTHVRGNVEFVPGGSENTGMFLAVKLNGNWQLVFDGQGAIACEQLEEYDFPEDMMTDCVIGQTVEVEKDKDFSIVLESNPTTGYQWEYELDSDYLEFKDRQYVADSDLIGAGGRDIFTFTGLKAGETEILFSYLRSWEEDIPPIEEKVYKIIIK